MNDEMSSVDVVVVIDNGSGATRAGFAGDDSPKVSLLSLVARRSSAPPVMTGERLGPYCGEEATKIGKKSKIWALNSPIEKGLITDWDDMEQIWHHTFYNELRVVPENHAVLLTEPPLCPKANRERMLQIMMETFNVAAVHFNIQAVLALYSSGRTTGCVLDSGFGATHSVPIYEGYHLPHATTRLPLAGNDVTEHLLKLLSEQCGEAEPWMLDNDIVNGIKENLCFVADDFDQVLTDTASGDDCQHVYKLLDGEAVVLGSSECAGAPEVLFQPHLAGYEFLGIADIVVNSIRELDQAEQVHMSANIVLAGGNTMFLGFRKRLSHEIRRRVAPEFSKHVMVHADPERQNAVWYGGSVLASLPAFSAGFTSNRQWITREEYDESGPSAVHRRPGF